MQSPQPAAAPTSHASHDVRRERWLAALFALLLAALVVGRPLFDADAVFAAVDTATQQLPWSAAIEPSADARPRNPALSDQGLVFYPYYRWVSRSWNALDAPSWNPYSYAGVPGYGNPQSGALDPQVALLVLLERLGGERAMDWGWALLGALRIALAGLGAYALARELGLARAGAALAGVSFALSGYVVLWLGYSLGHVPPFLPWILLGLERLRGARPARHCALVALALAGAILGGHPETSFYVGATAGVWALAVLARDRRAGWLGLASLALGALLAAPSLVTFLEYLKLSAAQQVRAANLAHERPDLIALGLLAIGAALCVSWRGAAKPAEVHVHGHGDHAHVDASVERVPWRHGLGVGLALAGIVLLMRWRGLSPSAWLVLAPDLHGAPNDGESGYRGIGTYVEEASGWLPLPVLALALAGLLQGGGALRRRGWIAALGVLAFLLCVRAPGLLDLYRYLPVIGLGATVRFGSVSALLLGLLAGDALERSSRAARGAAVVALGLVALLPLLWSGTAAPPEPALTNVEDTIGFVRVPDARLDAQTPELVGWLHPALAVELVRVVVERLDAAGQPLAERAIEVPAELLAEAPSLAGVALERVAAIPPDARWFRAPYLQTNRLEPGLWRFSVDLLRTRAGALERLARREVRVCAIERRPMWSVATIAFSLAGFAALLLLAECAPLATQRTRPLAWGVVLLAAAHGVWFARGQNPSVPRGEVFPLTRTERVLARELGEHRFLADPLVLPPNTGLVRGLRAVQGYDGLDVAAFNEFRRLAMKPGVHALLGWHPRGVELTSPAFRLLGVKLLALAEPLAAPGWELVAGPHDAPELAECWIYRCVDPLPRAFCVARAEQLAVIGARLAAREPWDPLTEAAVEEPWSTSEPFRTQRTSTPRFVGNAEVRIDVELDGDGLLVLTEQHFPGWTVRVDGVERPLLRVDGIFRGVELSKGAHDVVFRYEPRSLRLGMCATAIAALGLLALMAWARVRARTRAAV